jgi:hypothetical protein
VADNWVAPIDALLIINYINAFGPGQGEGEGEGEGDGALAGQLGSGADSSGEALAVMPLIASAVDLAPAPHTLGATSTTPLPPADAWVLGTWEVGFASRSVPRDEELWAELAEQWGVTDLDELLSALVGPATDEG